MQPGVYDIQRLNTGGQEMNELQNSQISQATILAMALSDSYPESANGITPAGEYDSALEAYLAYDEGIFDQAPLALDAYTAHLQDAA